MKLPFTLVMAWAVVWRVHGVPGPRPGFVTMCLAFGVCQTIATLALSKALKLGDISIVTALWKVSLMGVNGPIKFEKDGPAGKESGQSKPSIFVVQIRDGKVALPDFLAKK